MSTHINVQTELPTTQLRHRTCPFCSADISADVSLCGECGRFSRPAAAAKSKRRIGNPIELANAAIAHWEDKHQEIPTALKRVASLHVNVPVTATLTLGVVSLILAVGAAALWLRVGGILVFSGILAFLVMGAALLLSKRAIWGSAAVKPTDVAANDTSIHLYGYDINLALLQSVALTGMFLWALQSEIDEAWYAAAIAVLLTPLLFKTSRWPLSLAICVGGFGYLTYYWLVYSNSVYKVIADRDFMLLYYGDLYEIRFILFPYLLVFVLLALVPHFQLLNLGGIGPGRFKGDRSVHLLGSDVPLSFGTSLIFVSAWRAIDMAIYAPSWLPLALFG